MDLLQVCDHPLICWIVLFKIYFIRFLIKYKLEYLFFDKYIKSISNNLSYNYNKLPMGPSESVYDNVLETSKSLQQNISMKTNSNNGSNSSNEPSNNTNTRPDNNNISDRERENNRRIDNIIRGGPIGDNQGLPEGTVIRGNEAILPPSIRMDPSHNTTPNFNEIPSDNVHPSNSPFTRPYYTIFAAQRPSWGDASNFPVGSTNGPFRISDPENQIRDGYKPNGVNQPALYNISMALNEQTYQANSAVTLSRDMFTPKQEKFILDHLQIVNPRLYTRLTGDTSMIGRRRTVIPWNTVTNNSSFVRNFPHLNYSSSR